MDSISDKSRVINDIFEGQTPGVAEMIEWIQNKDYWLSAVIFPKGDAVVHIQFKSVPERIPGESLELSLYSAICRLRGLEGLATEGHPTLSVIVGEHMGSKMGMLLPFKRPEKTSS